MLADDVRLIAKATVVVLVISILLFKELTVVCFDQEFAASQGWPVLWLDVVLMGLVVVIAVMGLQSVGLLLVVALLIVPAAAARFWTDHLPSMAAASAAIGAASALFGVFTSAMFPRLAAGAVIVLVGSLCFVVSMFLGTRRGVLVRTLAHQRTRRVVGRHDLLRSFYECLESQALPAEPAGGEGREHEPIELRSLVEKRSWSPGRLRRLLASASRDGLVRQTSSGGYQLTADGEREARRVARNHRLWELYLITHADVAPSHVDRDADAIEHVLEPGLVEQLEALLGSEQPQAVVPPSPHQIGQPQP
jgi:manganese/zinc/iron transport system permease protein